MPKGPFKDHLRAPSAGWGISDSPYGLIETDGQEANTKRTLRPFSLNHSVGPLGCAALKHGLALAIGIPQILAAASWSVCSIRLHGCAVLKHGLALAIGPLVRSHDYAALRYSNLSRRFPRPFVRLRSATVQ